jgi:glycosyltransferase involved in cell wall biosynthesis
MLDPPRLRGRAIVCVGFADWETDLWTNQQHLMSRLACDNRVLFVESLGLRRPQLAGRDLARIVRRLRRGLRAPRAVDGLYVLSPLVAPLHGNAAVRALNRGLLRAQARRATRRLGMGRAILWAYVPQAEALIEALDPELVVYHCVDDAAAVAGIDAESFRATERRFAAQADLVLASAPALAARMRELSKNVLYAPNVADTALFARALEPLPSAPGAPPDSGRAEPDQVSSAPGAPNPGGTEPDQANARRLGPPTVEPDPAVAALPRPRIIFTGAIVATKLDVPLLAALARARPEWSFALVGPVGPGDPRTDVSALRDVPNIHLLGPRAYAQLPDALRAADAGLIPYARNAITESVFPMKVYEYLAAGLPVVATPLPALAEVPEVATAPDAGGIARLLEEAIAADSPERRAARSRAAAAHSWEQRLEEIAAAVGALPAKPRRGREMASDHPPDHPRPKNDEQSGPIPPRPGGLQADVARRTPRRRAPAVRDLLVSTHTPVLGSGRALRTYGVARALAAYGSLDLLYARFEGDAPDTAFRAIPGISLHEVVPSRGPRRLLAYGAARLGGVPAELARGVSPELATAAARLARAPNRGRVIADGPVAAAALARLARARPVIYNAHNFESGFRHELGEGRAMGGAHALRAFERGLLERAEESWMASEADVAAARELCPPARLRYVPNVVDVAAIVPVRPLLEERRAIFVANFAYEPNRNGLRFLLGEVFPLVWAELPDAKLALVGAGLEQSSIGDGVRGLFDDPRVEALGFVEDLRAAYASVCCAVVPLLQGGGTPLKLIEALAYGLPVVATPQAVVGLEVRDGEHCLIADSAEAFAAALVRVLRDGAPELSRHGQELVVERYSIEALTRLLAE